jgi:hypothetical protein
MTASLNDIERQMRERLTELEPLLEEATVLRRVLEVLDRPSTPDGERRRRRKSDSRRGRRPRASTTGGRRAEALRLVNERPGITVAELAAAMGIGVTYLYRVMPALQREGQIHKDGKGYHPAGA